MIELTQGGKKVKFLPGEIIKVEQTELGTMVHTEKGYGLVEESVEMVNRLLESL